MQGSLVSSQIVDEPGVDAFSLGVGVSVDIRPTVALIAEVIPTVVGGTDLGIHRPPFSFAIQKKLYRHAFTFGFTTSPGTTVSQRAGTSATFLDDPGADKPGGLFLVLEHFPGTPSDAPHVRWRSLESYRKTAMSLDLTLSEAITYRLHQIGADDGSDVEIASGLREGERVAATAAFLIDAESQLRAGLGGGR